MPLINSLKPKIHKWKAGDLISAQEAAELLGYKSAKQFQDAERLQNLLREFSALGCELTLDIYICGTRRFLRAEIDTFITKMIENAKALTARKRSAYVQT